MNELINKKYIFFICPILFCIELIFGYSGTMIMIGGLAIRHILFLLSFGSLYGFCFIYLIKNNIHIINLNKRCKNKSIIKRFTILDWSALLLIVSTLVSILFIPKLSGGNPGFAFDEMLDSVAMMSLYFPVSCMIRWKVINFKKCESVLSYLIVVLSGIHIVLYVGQTLNSNFIDNYFAFLNKIFFSTSITPGTVLGHGGYPRVIYSTSIFILIGIYILLKRMDKLKLYEYIFLEIHICALLTTMTKSIWYGAAIGTLIYCIGYFLLKLKGRESKNIVRFISVILSSVLVMVILNYTLFDGLVGIRLNNSFVSSIDIKEENPPINEEAPANKGIPVNESNPIEKHVELEKSKPDNNLNKKDEEGAIISNNIKIEQTKFLLNKWKSRPILGHGYGSYVEGYTRSENLVFSYEMLIPELLMKIGVVGIIIWGIFILSMIISILKDSKGKRVSIYAWLFLLISYGISIQTNPMLLSFTGISLLLYLAFACINETTKYNNEDKF